jgi:tetratricopeptide (TPR) repeat protein
LGGERPATLTADDTGEIRTRLCRFRANFVAAGCHHAAKPGRPRHHPVRPEATVAETLDLSAAGPASTAAEGWVDAAREPQPVLAESRGSALSDEGRGPAHWIQLVRSLANRGDLPGAGRACAAALARHRTAAELHYLDATLLGEAGHHQAAADAARRALYLDPELVVAHLSLAGALARLGRREEAARAVKNAERLLARMAPADLVPGADGESAGRLATLARAQHELLMDREPND